MLKVLKDCNKDPQKIIEDLQKWLDHWSGKNTGCNSDSRCSKETVFDLTKKSHLKFIQQN